MIERRAGKGAIDASPCSPRPRKRGSAPRVPTAFASSARGLSAGGLFFAEPVFRPTKQPPDIGAVFPERQGCHEHAKADP
jgi:hypothetical protein